MGNKPLITDELLPGGLVKGDNILGLMSAGWTNERHSTYISSMEASFVDQLYGYDKHGIDARRSHFGGNGIKVVRESACKNIRFEGPDGGRSGLPANLWARRFKPRDTGVNCHGDGAEDSGDDYGSGTDTVREKFRMHGRDVKGFAKETLIGKRGF